MQKIKLPFKIQCHMCQSNEIAIGIQLFPKSQLVKITMLCENCTTKHEQEFCIKLTPEQDAPYQKVKDYQNGLSS